MKLLAFFQLCCIFAVTTAYVADNGAINEKIAQFAPTDIELNAFQKAHNFNKFHPLNVVVDLMKDLSSNFPNIAKLEVIGKSYENRPLYNMVITSRDRPSKPVVMIECGIHSDEWGSVAAGSFIAHKLITSYGSDSEITALVDKYEFNILVNMNPDGYAYAWSHDREWRKTRSHNSNDWLDNCRGVDINSNFDVEHCGNKKDDNTCGRKYCGKTPFSESEARALRDLMIAKKDRISVYFALHTDRNAEFLTPYGFAEWLRPPFWKEDLMPVAQAGADAIKKFSGMSYNVASYATGMNIHYGMSVDYLVYELRVKYAFVIELRNHGWDDMDEEILLHVSQEAWEGIKAAINELK